MRTALCQQFLFLLPLFPVNEEKKNDFFFNRFHPVFKGVFAFFLFVFIVKVVETLFFCFFFFALLSVDLI